MPGWNIREWNSSDRRPKVWLANSGRIDRSHGTDCPQPCDASSPQRPAYWCRWAHRTVHSRDSCSATSHATKWATFGTRGLCSLFCPCTGARWLSKEYPHSIIEVHNGEASIPLICSSVKSQKRASRFQSLFSRWFRARWYSNLRIWLKWMFSCSATSYSSTKSNWDWLSRSVEIYVSATSRSSKDRVGFTLKNCSRSALMRISTRTW